jgi:hypothetical protein
MFTLTDPGLRTASLAYQIARAVESISLRGGGLEPSLALDRHALELVVQVVAASSSLERGDRELAHTYARASALACRLALEDARELDEEAYLSARSALARLVVELDHDRTRAAPPRA